MPNGDLTRDQERELVGRLIAGHNGAWEEFSQRLQHRIAACVRKAGVRDEDLEDVCAFVFESFLANECHRLRQWDGRARLFTYLFVVSTNLARDYLRNLPQVSFLPEEEIPEAGPDAGIALGPKTCALQAQLREAILECLFSMPAGADKEVLLFHYYAGLGAEEIARLSGKKRNAVDQTLLRARRNLREVAENTHPELLEYLGNDGRGM